MATQRCYRRLSERVRASFFYLEDSTTLTADLALPNRHSKISRIVCRVY